MISTSVCKLCGSDIQDSFPCSCRDQMNEAEKILAGIAESHATAGSGFIVRSGTGHIKCYHTLILVPDIGHTVDMRIAALYSISGEKLRPVLVQPGKGLKSLLLRVEFSDQLMCAVFPDHAGCFPFVV